ncbi:hypothetical protein B0H15DRAFT_841629 [Mycena belliarum]|uniref:Uncharacterized protein n=1 Tax=Mycena belliarum TaxID=1033014 RepID=A0AAD6XRZ8_9AGAR|nr:hypothetical protein B0H15DRAFT_841629 [Mycena belliae]
MGSYSVHVLDFCIPTNLRMESSSSGSAAAVPNQAVLPGIREVLKEFFPPPEPLDTSPPICTTLEGESGMRHPLQPQSDLNAPNFCGVLALNPVSKGFDYVPYSRSVGSSLERRGGGKTRPKVPRPFKPITFRLKTHNARGGARRTREGAGAQAVMTPGPTTERSGHPSLCGCTCEVPALLPQCEEAGAPGVSRSPMIPFPLPASPPTSWCPTCRAPRIVDAAVPALENEENSERGERAISSA